MNAAQLYKAAIRDSGEILDETALDKRDAILQKKRRWEQWLLNPVTEEFLATLVAERQTAIDNSILRMLDHSKSIKSLATVETLTKILHYAHTNTYVK